jgi:7,8-dihydro-6-hydroxymethylpterin dimethyltransferase
VTEYLTSTQSICRECRELIPAQLSVEESGVWMRKTCPEHGFQKALVYSDPQAYLNLNHFYRKASIPLEFSTEAKGCPHSCGFCPEHEQHICLPILEITDYCNWNCPICLVKNRASYHRTREEVSFMLDRLIRTEGQIDVLNLSGGEPTLNPHFREIIEECVSRKEILRISVSTNGSMLARNPELLRFLAGHRVIVSLQFDGLRDEVYEVLRGRRVVGEKLQLIELCEELGASMTLTATVAAGVNQQDIRDIAGLVFKRDHIQSAMFQPAAYAGVASRLGRPESAVTIPDIIASLDGAADGTVTKMDFSPLPCGHPACFALASYLRTEDGRYLPIKQMTRAERYLDLIQNRTLFGTDPDSFNLITDTVNEMWSSPTALPPDSQRALKAIRRLIATVTSEGGYSPARTLTAAERSVKSLFIHQFMDPDTFDLSRARKCCQVYPQPDGRVIPVCVYNCLKRS